jgi:hypothetical protein
MSNEETKNNGPEEKETPEEKPETRLEDLDEGEENEEDGDESEGPEKDDGKVYTKADIEKAAKRRQAALERARKAEAKAAELEKKHATEEERIKLEAAEEAARKAEEVYKPAILRKHLYFEMAALGLTKEQIPDIVDLVKMDKIEIDDEFNIDGVDEEIERIKQRFPKLFETDDPEEGEETPKKKTTAPKKRVPKGDGSPKPPPEKPKSARDTIAARLRGER